MQPLVSYNCTPQDIGPDEDYAGLYEHRKRNAVFALAYPHNQHIIALRDHLGVVPLFYRREGDTWRFATNLRDLVSPTDTLDPLGLHIYLVTGTTKIHPLFQEIGLVPPGTVLHFQGETVTTRYRYRWQPRTSPGSVEANAAFYFQQAMTRLLPDADTPVALFLSGGIDSGLIGMALKQAQVHIRGYTAGPWGTTSSDLPYARINADLIQTANHYIYPLSPEDYAAQIERIPHAYPTLHGTRAAINILPLWERILADTGGTSPIFYGQNLDTLACSMTSQSIIYFGGLLPPALRQRVHIYGSTPPGQYISYRSQGGLRQAALAQTFLGDIPWTNYNRLQQITLLGMLFAHTPADSDVIGQLAIQRNIPLANPYYDVDLIEFYLGVPLRHRLQLTRRKPFIKLQKRLHRTLARAHFPADLVDRTKGLTVPFEHHPHTTSLAASFPNQAGGISLHQLDQRFAAECLRRWGADIPAIEDCF